MYIKTISVAPQFYSHLPPMLRTHLDVKGNLSHCQITVFGNFTKFPSVIILKTYFVKVLIKAFKEHILKKKNIENICKSRQI